ncbi:EG45-like domain containing protein [Impatiens glandulifera]|uniref:EG45-like domain containing protein n=1 Tax=Impatiens glandulifera TaxID=253017 RepID=UPI001FB0C602|nr:EG45-like domain containing protein [Impatiens glandulifera]
MEKRMISSMIVIMMCITSTCLTPLASAKAGKASYYTDYTPSSCYGFENQGTLIAAANRALFNNKAACGRRYRVTCTGRTNQGVLQPCRGGSVTVKIVDLCPGCAADQLDLSKEAFSAIADPNAGLINIDYVQV